MTTKSTVATPPSTMSPASLLFATPKVKQLTDFSKPHKNEALLRFRNSTLTIVTLVLLTYLLPIPSLWKALNIVCGEGVVDAFWAVCAAGVPTRRTDVGPHADTVVLFHLTRGGTLDFTRTKPHPSCRRTPISTFTTSTFAFITRQRPAHPPRPKETTHNPVPRCM